MRGLTLALVSDSQPLTGPVLLPPCLIKCGEEQESGGAALRPLQTGAVGMVQINLLRPGPYIVKSCAKNGTMPKAAGMSWKLSRTPLTLISAHHGSSLKERGKERAKLIITSRTKTHSVWLLRQGCSFPLVFPTYYTSFHLVRHLKMPDDSQSDT